MCMVRQVTWLCAQLITVLSTCSSGSIRVLTFCKRHNVTASTFWRFDSILVMFDLAIA
jgi:hypothetical protein